MAKSNTLSIEARRVLKEYKLLGELKDFKPKADHKGREHFFADKIVAMAVGNINSKRRFEMESRGRRFSWRDTYHPHNSTIFDTRSYLIKELTDENTDDISK
jgi:hypothetical protein